MRCPHCAGEIPSGSRFCGICGRGITPAVGGPEVAVEGGRWPPTTSPFAPSVEAQADSISLFEMPASRTARRMRMALVLVLDAILAGAGVVMLMAYFESRGESRGDARPVDRATGAAGQGGAEDRDPGGEAAEVDKAGTQPSTPPGAASPPDAGAAVTPPRSGAKARPASTPAPARRPKPTPKPKSRPAPKDRPAIPDDGSRVDA